jgi:formylmethanofuran dehydrogenase subunit C
MQKGRKGPGTVETRAATAAGKKFGKYKDESERSLREQMQKDPVLEQLVRAWQALEYKYPGISLLQNVKEEHYPSALSLIEPIVYSPAEVEKFSIALSHFGSERNFGEKAGIFLSALINKGPGAEYIIHTGNAGEIENVGILNAKKIVVKGNGGSFLGAYMKEGSITGIGDVSECVGARMVGGKITVRGNAGEGAGESMDGGSISIEGNLGGNGKLYGGNLTVLGNIGELDTDFPFNSNATIRIFGEIGEIKGTHNGGAGKIYHKGKLIFGKE